MIENLGEAGYRCFEESGRKIIQDQVRLGGDAVPWDNAERFKDLMLAYALYDYDRAVGESGLIFFDRGILDVLAYARLENLHVSTDLRAAAETLRYHETVFLFPPWEEIYGQDAERKQDFAKAVATYERMVEVYSELGYRLVEVPKVSVEERSQFILERVSKT